MHQEICYQNIETLCWA